MINENLMHIKINCPEALESKKNLLNLELYSLNLMNQIGEYKKLRKIEFEKKIVLLKLIKKLNANLNKIRRLMPKINYPQKISNKRDKIPEIQERTANKKTDIEQQLENIQNRLKSLQEKF